LPENAEFNGTKQDSLGLHVPEILHVQSLQSLSVTLLPTSPYFAISSVTAAEADINTAWQGVARTVSKVVLGYLKASETTDRKVLTLSTSDCVDMSQTHTQCISPTGYTR